MSALNKKQDHFPAPCNNLTAPPPGLCCISHLKESKKYAAHAQLVSASAPAELYMEAASKKPSATAEPGTPSPCTPPQCHLQILWHKSKKVSSNSSFFLGLSSFGLLHLCCPVKAFPSAPHSGQPCLLNWPLPITRTHEILLVDGVAPTCSHCKDFKAKLCQQWDFLGWTVYWEWNSHLLL